MKIFLRVALIFACVNLSSQTLLAASSVEKLAQGLTIALNTAIPQNELNTLISIEQYRNRLQKDSSRLATGTVCQSACSSVKLRWGKLLFGLVKAWQPQSVLEIGSCIGISSTYLSMALDSNNSGRLISLERCNQLVPFILSSWDRFSVTRAEVRAGAIKETIKTAIRDLTPIDMVFDDENHNEGPTIKKFDTIVPFLSTPALYVFDDIAHNPGMKKAWNILRHNKHVAVSISIGDPHTRFGVCIIDKNQKNKQHLHLDMTKAEEVQVDNNGKLVIISR